MMLHVTNVIRIGNSTWHYGVWSIAWFPTRALLFVASTCGARHLEVLIKRRRTRVTWWWPCDMKSKDGIALVCL